MGVELRMGHLFWRASKHIPGLDQIMSAYSKYGAIGSSASATAARASNSFSTPETDFTIAALAFFPHSFSIIRRAAALFRFASVKDGFIARALS